MKMKLFVPLVSVILLIAIVGHVKAVSALAQEEYQITATLQAPELEEGAAFGSSVAVSGDIVVVSEPFATVEGKSKAGRAHIFDTDGSLLVTLQSPEPEARATFGWSVAVSGDVVAVGENLADVEGKENAGRAYVFDSSGNLLATLQAPTPQAGAYFGISVAVGGDIVAVGEQMAEVEGKREAGRAYIFDSDGSLLETLQAPELEEYGRFGRPVVVSGDVVAVGENSATVEGKERAGKAHIFDTDGSLLLTLQSPEPETRGFFGDSVAVSGDVVAVGETWADVEGKENAGKAYVFDSSGNLLATLQSPTPQADAWLRSVAVSGDIVAVADCVATVEGKENAGRVYIFDSSGNLLATLQAPTPQVDAEFGASKDNHSHTPPPYTLHMLAVSGGILVIGERLADVEGVSDAGRAYVIRSVAEPADEFGSWAPYIVLASGILVVAAATAIYVMRRKKRQ